MSVATLPALAVEADGAALPAPALAALSHVRVHRRLAAPALCELTFHDGPDLDLATLPALGAELRLALAADGAELFAGDVTAVEHVHGPDRDHAIRVRGYDPMHRLRRTQHVVSRSDASLGSIAQELAGDIGLSAEAPSGDLAWPRHLQLGESDLEQIALLADRAGVFATVGEGTLRFLTLEGAGEPVELALGTTLLEARVEHAADRGAGAVTATGWNATDAEAHTGTASTPRLGRAVGGAAPSQPFGQSGESSLLGSLLIADDHAQALAQGALDLRAAHELTLWGVADGDARLAPGGLVSVIGLGEHGDGTHVLTEVRHTIDDRRGFVSELSTAPPAARTGPPSAVATLGEVTSVSDPEERGRVQVKLLAYGDVESDWLGVLVPGAGEGKGLIALPDVGDTVLVVLPSGGAGGAGVVMGGLYGAKSPPDAGVEGGAIKRYTLRTPAGQLVTLDDANKAVRLEDETGSYLELTPEKVLLHSAVDLALEAPGRAVTVTGNTIDFRQG